jgi:hypothetical protein
MKRTSKDTAAVEFRALLSVTTTVASGFLNLAPGNLGARVAGLADSYDLFKLAKLRFRLPVQAPGSSVTSVSCCFAPGITDGVPATPAAVNAYVNSCYLPTQTSTNRYQTVPTDWVRVDTGDLHGPAPWYKTIGGSPDAWDEQPAQLLMVAENASGNVTVLVEVEGTIVFRGGADPGSTPQARVQARKNLERKRILSLLAEGSSTAKVVTQ